MVYVGPQTSNKPNTKLGKRSEAVLDVEMAMTNHFTAQHQNTAYNQKNTDNFFNNMFIQSVSTDFLEHTEGNAFLCSLTKGVFDWCNMTNQMLDALPNLYSFPQTIDFFPQLNTTSDFLPIHHHMLESSEPVSSFLSDKEETNLSQFLMQMLPESAAVLPEKANAVDVHPVPDFSSGKVNEWEKTFKEQYGNKKEPYETRIPVDFLPSSSNDLLKSCLQEELEEHWAKNSQAAVWASNYIGDTYDKTNYHREIGLNKWAIDNNHLAEEYWAAVDLYEKNVHIKEPLSVELATEFSKRRIWELTTENNRNRLIISLAYIFAIYTMNSELARDINAVMSFQNEPETFGRLENYFAERYKKEMIRLN